jgi:biopolymer transport protein ExbD
MTRLSIAAALMAALCACASEDNARDRREVMEQKRALELQRQQLDALQAKIDAEKRSGLHVSLPSGAAQDIDVTRASVVIMLPATGDPVVSGRAMSDQDLDNLFRAAFVRDKTTQVVIQADRGVAHGRVVAIMEKAKAAGLTRLAIGTSPQ